MRRTSKQLHQDWKRNFVIERLEKLNVRQSQDGKSIYELDYESLKIELVLAEFRKIDMDCDAGKWF